MSVAVITIDPMSVNVIRYDAGMGRWEPNAKGRLERAALELYVERGFEQTKVAEIAQRAGLTERTFFRHFADKREVLFWGAGALQKFLVDSVDAAPASRPPIGAIADALCAAADEIFEERREFASRRQAIIDANPELQERELIKLASLASALADALRRKGVSDPASGLAAEAGIAVFKISFVEWIHDGGDRTLSEGIRAAVDELRQLTGGRRTTVRG